MRLYRGAQRLLALEEQLVEEVGGAEEGELQGRLEIGASTGPGGIVWPCSPASSSAEPDACSVALSVHDTQHVIDLVAERELELGVVGAAPRQRGVRFETVLPRRGDPRLPARPSASPAGRSRSTSSATSR